MSTMDAFAASVRRFSPRLLLSELLLKQWFEPVIPFTVMISLWLYFALTESSEMQATPGKRCCKIIVTDLHGNRVSFGRASGRYFAKIVSVLTLGIGFLMAGLTQRKQALHDLIADCLVLRRRPEILRLPGEGAVTT